MIRRHSSSSSLRVPLFALALSALALMATSSRGDDQQRGWFPADDAKPAAKTDAKPDAKEDKITLERLFPEKSFFGPSASGPAFSIDGRYAAYLWRPWIERRHGSDLWLHDFDTGETKRITMVSVMSGFQEDARKVRDDRVKKVKEKKGKAGPAEPEKRTEKEPPKPAVDDGVSGTWSGRVTGQGVDFLPPDGVAVTLELLRAADNSVSGMLKSSLFSVAISEGKWEAATSTLSFTLRIETMNAVARVEAKLETGKAKGTVTLDGSGAILTLEAERQASDANGDATKKGEDSKKTDEAKKEDAKTDDAKKESDASTKVNTARDFGDVVDEKDADDEKAPRYGGVQGFEWSPASSELFFSSAGDLFRLVVADGSITRLSRSREDEREVQWLPDGSGYTYMRGGRGSDLIRVGFNNSLIEQINPRLPTGEEMAGYRLSPDGKRLVFLVSKGAGAAPPGRSVNIVNYRDRFAQVQQVPRTMPDDPLPEVEQSIYLYELADFMSERGQLKKVYSRKQSGPRDVLRVPEWAPDSSRVAFSVFEQSSGRVEILEAAFVEAPKEEPKKEEPKKEEAKKDDAKDATKADESTKDESTKDESRKDDASKDEGAKNDTKSSAPALAEPPADPKPVFEIREAKVVYRFLHNGGPTTPSLIRPQYLADSRRLVFISELSGFRQLHVLDPTYEQLEQLTRGRFEIYPLEVSKDHKRLFTLATKDDPEQQHLYRVELDSGEMTRLSKRDGFHDAAGVSDDGTRSVVGHADFGSLRELFAIDRDGSDKQLTSSHPDEAKKLTTAAPEYFTYLNRHGQTIHGHMFKPKDWTARDKRPLLIWVYGGPLGQNKMATRGSFAAPSYFFAWYMATVHGYVTCTIDPRGASGYGGLFEKSNYEQVGKPQVEDLVDGAKWFIANAGVDPKRVGMHGWSFGGFQTQMCLYTEPDVFAVGIAGAGPTEWENYNAWYSTGTIGPNRAGQVDLAKFSLLPLAKNLKSRLLLVHGVEDSNVLYQDTVRVYRELLKAGKEALVDLFIDPTGGHGLGGDVKTLNRYRKYEDYLVKHLGKGEAAPPEPEKAPEPAAGAAPGEPTPPPVVTEEERNEQKETEKEKEAPPPPPPPPQCDVPSPIDPLR